jgi:hypothetical protein
MQLRFYYSIKAMEGGSAGRQARRGSDAISGLVDSKLVMRIKE